MAEGREEGHKPEGRARAGKGQPDPSLNRPRRGPCAKAGGQGGKRDQGDKVRIDHKLYLQFFLLSSTCPHLIDKRQRQSDDTRGKKGRAEDPVSLSLYCA
jgi:hypothetical protein